MGSPIIGRAIGAFVMWIYGGCKGTLEEKYEETYDFNWLVGLITTIVVSFAILIYAML